jgi:hypothetical protein
MSVASGGGRLDTISSMDEAHSKAQKLVGGEVVGVAARRASQSKPKGLESI